jgi:hypothetical protein
MWGGDDEDAAGTDGGAEFVEDEGGVFEVLDDVPDDGGVVGCGAEVDGVEVAEDFVAGGLVVGQLLGGDVDDGDFGVGGEVDVAG